MPRELSRESEVVQPGDDVLDAGTDLSVRAVVLLLPVGQLLSSHAVQSLRLPGRGSPTTTIRRVLGDAVIAGGHQGAVHDQHGVLREPAPGLEREEPAELVDDLVGRRLRDVEAVRVGASSGSCASRP